MITADRLREVLDYDPVSGEFRWRISPRYGIEPGDIAGYIDSGYRKITVDGEDYRAHRIAWLHHYGVWPETGDVDHRNQIGTDNRISNLRPATRAENLQNQDRPQRNSQSGLRGVGRDRGRWRARIRVEGVTRLIGYFATAEEASAAYFTAKRELHPFWDDAS